VKSRLMRASAMVLATKRVPDRQDSKCKGPEVGLGLKNCTDSRPVWFGPNSVTKGTTVGRTHTQYGNLQVLAKS
jgi:hypothetical protein